ncbi:hypothetical protein ACI6Q2_21445 [Chitinophagaceae bacterium LWZ2-11]
MKKLIIAAAFVLTVLTGAIAAPASFKGEVHFKANYPKATNISYKMVGTLTEVNFTLNGQDLQAFYNEDGSLVATSKRIKLADLPLRAQAEIQSKYKDFDVREIIEMDQEEEGVSFYASLENDTKKLILNVTTQGNVNVFKRTKK